MKTYSYQGCFIATLLTLLLGCQKKDADTPTPANDSCQLETILTVSQVGERWQETYAYSLQGLLLSITTSSTAAPGKATASVATKRVFEYDNNGFLLSEKEQNTVNNNPNAVNSEINYEYANGRLVKQTTKYYGQFPTETVNKYAYDNTGKLTSYTQEYGANVIGAKEIYSFTNGVLTGGTRELSGKIYPLTVTDGRIVEIPYESGVIQRYTYDSQGYRVKEEGYLGAKVVFTQTFELGPVPIKYTYPTFKGIPAFSLYGKDDRPTIRNVYKSDTYSSESNYSYQINSKGYPISSTSKYISSDGVNDSFTSSYRYTNCQ